MPTFRYNGRSVGGYAMEGEIEADDKGHAASKLLNGGITPLTIDEVVERADVVAAFQQKYLRKPVKLDDLILFCRQAHALTKSGVPLIRAFNGLADGTANLELRDAIKAIVVGLQSGRTLSAGMADHPRTFPPIFVNLIQVGEESGRLDEALLQLAFYLELEKETRNRIKSALRYPTFVIIAIVIALMIVNVFVIPAFAKVFAGFGAELPIFTRILIGFSDFTVAYWPHIGSAATLGVIALRHYLKSERGAYLWDRKKLRLPIVGSIILRATLGRFARAFAMASRSGVPLLQAMGAVALAVDNRYVTEQILAMRTGIESGDTLTRTAASTGLFTPLVLQMMAVGEETGALDSLMQEVAEFYEREVDYDLKGLSASIEPILLSVVGALVLVLALGIFLPMWDLAGAALHR